MATVMKMQWAGIGRDQYDAIRKELDLEGNPPPGGKYHVAWVTPEGVNVLDVWESGKEFEQFVQGRLMPIVQKLNIPGQPKIELFEAHATFAPNP